MEEYAGGILRTHAAAYQLRLRDDRDDGVKTALANHD